MRVSQECKSYELIPPKTMLEYKQWENSPCKLHLLYFILLYYLLLAPDISSFPHSSQLEDSWLTLTTISWHALTKRDLFRNFSVTADAECIPITSSSVMMQTFCARVSSIHIYIMCPSMKVILNAYCFFHTDHYF